ncbi:MAG: blaR1 8 [Planctomycetaceae bacterium]|nr:blaR1 8 [Planctomycetaceae bacterium]
MKAGAMNLFADQNLSVVILLTLAHFLWQGTLLAGLAAIVAGCFKTPRARYRVLVGALGLMAAAPAFTLVIYESSPTLQVSDVTEQGVPHVARVDNTIASTTLSTFEPDALRANESSLAAPVLDSRSVAPGIELAASPNSFQVAISKWQRFAPLILNAYLLVVAGMLLRFVIGLRGGTQLRRAAVLIEEPHLLQALRRQVNSLGLKVVPLLAYCEQVAVPTVIGIFTPTILLPFSVMSGLSPQQIEAILSHELAHLRRYDHLVNLLQRMLESLYFFHPAVWWLSQRIRLERECCCDDLAVACGAAPLDYAVTLLRIAELSLERKSPRVLAAGGLCVTGQPSTLRERIARLLGEPTDHHLRFTNRWPAFVLAGISFVMACSTSYVGWNLLAEPKAKSSQTTTESPDNAAGANKNQQDGPAAGQGHVVIGATPLKRYEFLMAQYRQQLSSGQRAAGLPLLKQAVAEFAQVNDQALLAARSDYEIKAEMTAVWLRSASQWELASLLRVDSIGDAIQLADSIVQPFYKAMAYSDLAVTLPNMGRKDESATFLDRALTVALTEVNVPANQIHRYVEKEAAWKLLPLDSIGKACLQLNDTIRIEVVMNRMIAVRGEKHDAHGLLLKVASHKLEQNDLAGVDSVLDRIAAESKRDAPEIREQFWSDVCNSAIDLEKFEVAAAHVNKIPEQSRGQVRAHLVCGWSRKGNLDRAKQEWKFITDTRGKWLGGIFIVRATLAAGRKDEALKLYESVNETLVESKDSQQMLETMILISETLAIFEDFQSAETCLKLWLETTSKIGDPNLKEYSFFSNHSGTAADFYGLPYQTVVNLNTARLLLGRAQLRAGKIEAALKTAQSMTDPDKQFGAYFDRDRAYLFGMIAQKLVQTGKADRVNTLLKDEKSDVVRTAMQIELQK